MQKKLRFKPYVLPITYLGILFVVVGGVLLSQRTMKPEETLTYVSEDTFDMTIPVMTEDSLKLIRPYTNEKVKEVKYYYDYTDDQTRQENSIIYHEGTYMQNSGVDFTLEEAFDVISVLDGTVIDVKEDELLGKTVEIRHNNDLISVYQSLGEVSVKKDDTVKQGQVIGKSGTNELNPELVNHLHFEISKKGQVVDPEKYFDQALEETEN